MIFTSKKAKIEKIKEFADKASMEIKEDLELFKTFDSHIGTGLIPDGRKYLEELTRIKYADTSDLAPFPLKDSSDGINNLSKMIPMTITSPPTTSW